MALAIVAALVFVTGFAMTPAAAAGNAIPTEGALWGSSSQWIPNYPLQDRVADLEVQLGSDLQALRLYHFWEERFPTQQEEFLLESDIVPVISVDTRNPDWSRASWPAIANAAPGDGIYENIVAWADDFKAYGRPIIVSLNHEPDYYRNGGNGKAADYVAAYRRFVQILRNQGADNVSTMFIGVAWNFDSRSNNPIDQWYPGDDVVDYAGADGYNWNGCGPTSGWRSFEQIFQSFLDWSANHDTRLLIGEFGSVEHDYDTNRKAQWLEEAAATLASPAWDAVDVVLYWNRTHESEANCKFRMDTTNASLDGARILASASVFRNAKAPTPAPSTTTTTAPPAPSTTTTTAPPATTTTTTTAPAPAPSTTTTTTSPIDAGPAASAAGETGEVCVWDPASHQFDRSYVEILTASSVTNTAYAG